MAIFSASPTASLHRNTRRNVRPDSTHGVLNVSPVHSRRYSFHVNDLDYDTACTVINNIVKTDLSLWMPGLSEDARRHVCVQCRSRCCNCGSTERILSWCRTSEARI